MCGLVAFVVLYLVAINVNAFDYDRSFLAEVKPKIREKCYKDLLKGDKNLREFIIQAVSVWNAKTPGLLNGSHDYTGNYAECLDSKFSPVVMQYCVLDVGITYKGETPMPCKIRAENGLKPCSPNESSSPGHILKWALCTVSACSKYNLLVMAEVLLQKSDIGRAGLPFEVSLPKDACQTSEKIPFRPGTIIFFWTIGAIATVITICTAWHWNFQRSTKYPKLKAPVLVRNWSIMEHFSSLVATFPGDIQLFHCLKVMTTLAIIFTHELFYLTAGPVANLSSMFYVMQGLRFLRADMTVDTFFTIAGFILVRKYSYANSQSLIDQIMTRYFRLIPVFALIVFYASSVLDYIGSGPFWPIVANMERDSCQKNGWFSLLMMGTYMDWNEQCWLVSWHLPCDFYFFIVGILMCRLIKKNEKLGVAAISLLLVAAIVYLGAYIALNNQLVMIPIMDDSLRHGRDVPLYVYFQARFRISSYLVGMLGGYITKVLTEKKITISRETATVGFLLSGTILGLIFVSGFFYGTEVPYNVVTATLYGSLVRPLWCLGLVLLTLVVELSKSPIVSAFTNMRMWAPLSRLTFCMYLVHIAVILPSVGSQMQPYVFTVSGLLVRTMVDSILTVLVSLVVYLCVERPFYGLFLLILANFRIWRKSKFQ